MCGWTHNKRPKDKYETAKCKDASLSYSRHSQGTCSHHGVRYWFKQIHHRAMGSRSSECSCHPHPETS
ncbi:DUF3761 domain-containing protein [Streptomyces bungoensis]|uniref:DUF3761 domain-containing protein n=1 Tax=Streptomyces bungoensis TaxID=285568 RepID=UPI00342AB203